MISHPSRHCTVELQALPSRIGQVRRIVSAHLRYWHLDPLIDQAALGVTELLSNVHRHARPDKTCTVEMELMPDRLTVSVHDHDPRLPVLADPPFPGFSLDAGPDDPLADGPGGLDTDALATCGRGLAMVAAVSADWGARPEGDAGKVVWFALAVPDSGRAPADLPPRRVAHAVHEDAPRVFAEVDAPRVTTPAPARSAVVG